MRLAYTSTGSATARPLAQTPRRCKGHRLAGGRGLVLAIALLAGCSPTVPPPCGGQGIICRIAGTGVAAFDGDGKPALETSFYLPSAVRVASDGRVLVMDFNNHRLRRIEPNGTVSSVVGNGVHAFAVEGARAESSPLENPSDFAFAADGAIVLVTYHDPRVLRVGKQGVIEVLAGNGELGDAGDGGPALKATFDELVGITLGADGAIYVSDDKSHRVRMIKNGTVTAVAGVSGKKGYQGDGGAASMAPLAEPQGLAIDPQGRLLIADAGNHVIRRVDANGIIETIAGSGKKGFAGDGGPAKQALLNRPHGIHVASDGSITFSDRDNDRIRRIAPSGVIDTIAGSTAGNAGDGGPALQAQLRGPGYLDVTPHGIYLADQLNHCARVIYSR
jgi:sugar lactone lactonase YvrE